MISWNHFPVRRPKNRTSPFGDSFISGKKVKRIISKSKDGVRFDNGESRNKVSFSTEFDDFFRNLFDFADWRLAAYHVICVHFGPRDFVIFKESVDFLSGVTDKWDTLDCFVFT